MPAGESEFCARTMAPRSCGNPNPATGNSPPDTGNSLPSNRQLPTAQKRKLPGKPPNTGRQGVAFFSGCPQNQAQRHAAGFWEIKPQFFDPVFYRNFPGNRCRQLGCPYGQFAVLKTGRDPVGIDFRQPESSLKRTISMLDTMKLPAIGFFR